jgi:murein DD-endopeptidase MepM/ murein hydrolase activator NlpD
VSGTVAKASIIGMAALLTAAPSGLAASGSGSGGAPYQLGPAAEGPTGPTGSTGSGGSGGTPYSTAPQTRSARPVVTIFSASASSINAGRPVVRFQVSDRSARVRVRLAFIGLLDHSTYRANLGSRRTQITHSYTWSPPQKAGAGSYRVRITVRDPAGYRAVRGTTVSVSPPAPASDHRFPVAGAHTFGGPSARFGASRTGHTHQGQDIMAAQGTPVIAPHAGQVTFVAYQAKGAGYYIVITSSGEPYTYVFMHLQQGSVLVKSGQAVTMGQRIAAVGATGDADGPHLHFEIWDGPWYNGGHPIDPLPFLKQWPGA